MAVQLRFNSEKRNYSSSQESVTKVFYAQTLTELRTYITTNYAHDTTTSDGKVSRTRYYQNGGPAWFCEVTCVTDKVNAAETTTDDGPQKHILKTVCVPMELNRLNGYRTIWDHYLWQLCAETASTYIPASASTATTDTPFSSGSNSYAWTKTASNTSLDAPGEGYVWKNVLTPEKPGVKYVDFFTYQITEYGEYATERKAAWALQNQINSLRSAPPLGNMGITTSGTWRLDSATIRHNGSHWEAACVWTLGNWDTDLYPVVLKTPESDD